MARAAHQAFLEVLQEDPDLAKVVVAAVEPQADDGLLLTRGKVELEQRERRGVGLLGLEEQKRPRFGDAFAQSL